MAKRSEGEALWLETPKELTLCNQERWMENSSMGRLVCKGSKLEHQSWVAMDQWWSKATLRDLPVNSHRSTWTTSKDLNRPMARQSRDSITIMAMRLSWDRLAWLTPLIELKKIICLKVPACVHHLKPNWHANSKLKHRDQVRFSEVVSLMEDCMHKSKQCAQRLLAQCLLIWSKAQEWVKKETDLRGTWIKAPEAQAQEVQLKLVLALVDQLQMIERD